MAGGIITDPRDIDGPFLRERFGKALGT